MADNNLIQVYPQSLQSIFVQLIQCVQLTAGGTEAATALTAELALVKPYLALRPNLAAMNAKSVQAKAAKRLSEQFTLRWGTCAGELVIGWPALAKRLRLKESTLRVMFSKGKGTLSLSVDNPEGRLDTLDVLRQPKPAKPKRGRPVGSIKRPKRSQAIIRQELTNPTGNKLRGIQIGATFEPDA